MSAVQSKVTRPGHRRSKPFRVVALILALLSAFLGPNAALTQVYRWQDEEGKWHFSDKPPPGQTTADELKRRAKPPPTVSRDLATQLVNEVEPSTAVERASLAVVAISTPLGIGSGFFVTDAGHIVTNKHVIRVPPWWLSEQESQIARREQAFRAAERDFIQAKQPLNRLEAQVKQAAKVRREARNTQELALADARLKFLEIQLKGRKAAYYNAKKRFDADKRAFDKAKSEFRFQVSRANAASSFEVTLKNDMVLHAHLIALSSDQDLALLKVDGYVTPFLSPASFGALALGISVYAIGSPLGLKDFVTSGIVNRIQEDQVWFDARILPGNSGGPLVTEAGEVVGVNTYRMVEQVTGSKESWGIAISIDRVREVFRDVLSG